MRENSLLKAFTDIFHKALSFLKRILSSPVGRRKLLYGFLKRLLILYLLFWVYAFIAYPEFVPRSLAHLPELSLILPCLFSLILALPLFPPYLFHISPFLLTYYIILICLFLYWIGSFIWKYWRDPHGFLSSFEGLGGSRKGRKPYSKSWTAFLRRMNHVREFLCRPRKKRKGSCEVSGKGCFTFILRSRFIP